MIVVANLFDDDPRRIGDRIPCYALFIDPALGRVGMTQTGAGRAASASGAVGGGLGSRLKRLQAVGVPVSDYDRQMRRARFSRCAWSQPGARRGGPSRGPMSAMLAAKPTLTTTLTKLGPLT